jgi:hypothetical protein
MPTEADLKKLRIAFAKERGTPLEYLIGVDYGNGPDKGVRQLYKKGDDGYFKFIKTLQPKKGTS